MRLSEFLNEAPAQPVAAPAIPTATQQARLKDMEAGQAKGKTAINKFDQGDNVGGVMTAASGLNDLANAAGMSFLQKLETGWMAMKAGARAAWAGRKGNADAAINAAIGSLGGEISELGADIVNEPDFAQKFQQGMLAMKDSTDPDQQEMYKKYMSRQLTAESFKAYMIRFNTAIQNMKKNPETAQLPTDDTPYVTPVENPTGPNANPMSQDPAQQAQRAATTETAELDRILKLSGMEFIAEDATATQQFVGTGSSRDWSMSDTIATLNATKQMIKQKYGNRPPPGNGIELKYYNKQQKTIADPAKPGNYLTTVTFTPIESKLSPAISVKPSMDPNQDFDYFYNGQQVKPGDAFFDRIKQIHDSLGAGAVPAQPEAPANETTELSRLSKLISEGSTKSITVQRGDTLGRIAQNNSTTVAAIVKLNNIANPDRIYPGDVIRIPGGQGDPGGRAKRQGQPSAPDIDSTPDIDSDPDNISRVERAWLNMIAQEESSDDYTAINYKARAALKKGTMQITGKPGQHPFDGQSGVTAAGRYQMLYNTWKTAAKLAGVDPADFSPENQDRAAIALAKNEYKRKYNRDLITDLQDPKRVDQAVRGSTGPWSVKAGGPGFSTQDYVSALSDTQAA